METGELNEYFGKWFEITGIGGGNSSDVSKAVVVKEYEGLKVGQFFAMKSPKDTSEGGIKRFIREAETLARIHTMNDAGNFVINYYKTLRTPDENIPVLLLELADYNLDFLRRKYRASFSEEIMDRTIKRICKGLSLVHSISENGEYCLHRDIKPSNILIFNNGLCKLGDFGSAGFTADNPNVGKVSSSYGLYGTPNYSAPEALGSDDEKKLYSFQSDIYSVGLVAFYLVAGRTPFQGEDEHNTKVLKSKKRDIKFTDSAFKTMLGESKIAQHKIELIRRAIDPDPKKRPDSIDKFLSEYEGRNEVTFFDSCSKEIKNLLERPYSTPHGATPIELVDAFLSRFDEMRAYAKSHGKSSSAVSSVEELIRKRAEKDYKLLEDYIPVIKSRSVDYSEFFSSVVPFIALIHCWSNEYYSLDFVNKDHSGRITDPNILIGCKGHEYLRNILVALKKNETFSGKDQFHIQNYELENRNLFALFWRWFSGIWK